MSLSALVLHDYSPYFAAYMRSICTHSSYRASQNQSIKIFDTAGECLSQTRYHDGFFGQRIAPVNTLAFHPQKLFLSAGGMDQLVSVYGVDKIH
jgi:WD40 repeat protein